MEHVVARVTDRAAAAVAAPIADIVPLTHAAADRQIWEEATAIVMSEARRDDRNGGEERRCDVETSNMALEQYGSPLPS